MILTVVESSDQFQEKVLIPIKTKRWQSFAEIFRGNTPWVLLIVILNLIFFGDAIFTDKTFFLRDVSFFAYPLKKLVTEAYSRGEWPLWNPYIQLGQPLLANPNAMAFYPTQLLFHLFPFHLAFELHFVLHSMLAGIAFLFLARELGLSGFSAFIASVLYNFSGVSLSFVNLYLILPAVPFLPLLSFSLLRLLKAPSIPKIAWNSFLVGCFFLLLEPLCTFGVALFVVPFLISSLFCIPSLRAARRTAFPLLLAVFLLALLLVSVQIFPTFEMIQKSGRRGGMDLQVITFWSMHPINLLQVIFPRIFGDYFKLANPTSWGSRFFVNREPYLLSCYIGLFPLLLAVAGIFFRPQRWLRTLLVVVAGVGLLLALGKFSPVYEWLFRHCPLFRYGRYPVKYLLVVNFCIAMLAGLGLDDVIRLRNSERMAHKKRWRWLALGLVSACFLGLLFSALSFEGLWPRLRGVVLNGTQVIVTHGGQTLIIGEQLIQSALRQAQVHLVILIVFLGLIAFRKIRSFIIQSMVAIFLFVDLFTSNFWINPLTLEDFYETPPVAKHILDQMKEKGPERVYRFQDEEIEKLPSVLGATDSVMWVSLYRKLTLYQFLSAKDHIHFAVFGAIDRMETLPSQIISSELRNTTTLAEKLDFLAGLNVGYILSMHSIESPLLSLDGLFRINSEQPLRVYRLQNCLPRAFVVPDAKPSQEMFQSFESYLAVRPDRAGTPEIDLSRSAAPSASGQVNTIQPSVLIQRYDLNQIDMEAKTDKAGVLILLDSYFPGWHAFVDGKETPVKSINFVFRGVSMPSGRHHITFRYLPDSFKYGLWISSGGALIWMVLLLTGVVGTLRRRFRQPVRS